MHVFNVPGSIETSGYYGGVRRVSNIMWSGLYKTSREYVQNICEL